MMELTIIAAVAENGVIGDGNDIPWYYPEDFKHFKETTLGSPVIMGRSTFTSILSQNGAPLPDRKNIVVTNHPNAIQNASLPAVRAVMGIDVAVEVANSLDDEAYVIGGQSIYEQFIDDVDRMILTEIPGEYEGDTYFPEWDESEWDVVDRESSGELVFATYERS